MNLDSQRKVSFHNYMNFLNRQKRKKQVLNFIGRGLKFIGIVGVIIMCLMLLLVSATIFHCESIKTEPESPIYPSSNLVETNADNFPDDYSLVYGLLTIDYNPYQVLYRYETNSTIDEVVNFYSKVSDCNEYSDSVGCIGQTTGHNGSYWVSITQKSELLTEFTIEIRWYQCGLDI